MISVSRAQWRHKMREGVTYLKAEEVKGDWEILCRRGVPRIV